MSQEFEDGKVVGKAEERKTIIDAIVANPNLIAECTHTNENGTTIFMAAKFIQKLEGTWVEPVAPEEPPAE